MVVSRKCLKLLVIITFTFGAVTLISHIEYVITVLPIKHTPVIINPNRGEETTNLDRKLFDIGTCAIPPSLIDDSQEADSQRCKVPNVDPFNEYVMEAITTWKSISCKGRLFTEYENNVFRLLDDVKEGMLDFDHASKRAKYFNHTRKQIYETYHCEHKSQHYS